MARQARAVKTRQDIILAAAKIIDEKNYEKASLKEIAERGGFTQGAVYFHFDSKEALAHAVIEAQNEISQQQVSRVMARDLSGLEILLEGSAILTRGILEDQLVRAGIRLFTEVQMFSQPTLGPWKQWAERNAEVLKQGIEEGDVKEDLDIEAYSEFMSGAYAGVQLLSGLTSERKNLLRKVCDMWVIILTAMTRPERTDYWIQRAKKLFLEEEGRPSA